MMTTTLRSSADLRLVGLVAALAVTRIGHCRPDHLVVAVTWPYLGEGLDGVPAVGPAGRGPDVVRPAAYQVRGLLLAAGHHPAWRSR